MAQLVEEADTTTDPWLKLKGSAAALIQFCDKRQAQASENWACALDRTHDDAEAGSPEPEGRGL